MVRVGLQIRANLECVEKLYTNHPHYQWFFKLKCNSCGMVTEKYHDLMESEKIQQKNSRSEANLIIKCKICSRENSLDVVPKSNEVYTAEDSGKFKTLVVFTCRGIEPVEFSPRSGWIVESAENGKKFEDIDLSEKEWADYDDKNNNAVGIYELESQIVKVKK